MQNRERALWWLAAALSIIVGLLLVWRLNHNGWFLVMLGTAYLGVLIGTARRPAVSNPRLIRWWGLAGITLLLLVLVVIVGAVLRG
jgi:hypothetical protein